MSPNQESNPLLEIQFRIPFDRIRSKHIEPAVLQFDAVSQRAAGIFLRRPGDFGFGLRIHMDRSVGIVIDAIESNSHQGGVVPAAGRGERRLAVTNCIEERPRVRVERRHRARVDEIGTFGEDDRAFIAARMTRAAPEFGRQAPGPASPREIGKHDDSTDRRSGSVAGGAPTPGGATLGDAATDAALVRGAPGGLPIARST